MWTTCPCASGAADACAASPAQSVGTRAPTAAVRASVARWNLGFKIPSPFSGRPDGPRAPETPAIPPVAGQNSELPPGRVARFRALPGRVLARRHGEAVLLPSARRLRADRRLQHGGARVPLGLDRLVLRPPLRPGQLFRPPLGPGARRPLRDRTRGRGDLL